MSDPAATPMPPLAIIGLGCHFPGSSDRAGFWARVVTGYDAIRPVPPSHWRAEDYHDADPKAPDKVYAARGAFLEAVPFPPGEFGIAPNNLEATDSSQLLGLLAATQALEDAGYAVGGPGPRSIPRGRVGVILGVTGTLQLVIPLGARLGHPLWRKALREAGVDDETAQDVIARISDGYVPWQENSFPGLLGNVVAGRIANRLDLGGTNCVVDAACASSLGAVHLAALELATGRADVVLTGGTDTFNDVFMFTCFSKTPALSPTGDARPFDADGDGTVLGEGLGVLVLKRLDDALRDGDRVYAVLRGIGSSSDGKGGAIYAPRLEGQVEALNNAYRAAGVTPDSVELVEAHGTGTRVGDATEAGALAEVFTATGRPGTWCALGSIKSQLGHTKAAAGAAGLIKAALALYHKVLPPTIKVRKPQPQLMPGAGPLYVNSECRPWMPAAHPRRAGVSAFGFGGSNFHAVLEEASPEPPEPAWTGPEIIALCAASPDDLSRQLAEWPADEREARRRAFQSRQSFRADAPWRLVLVGGDARQRDDARRLLQASGGREPPGAAPNTFLSHGPAPGDVALLFPGQGAQQTGMLRDVVCHFPAAFTAFRAAHLAFEQATGRRLVDLVYPQPAWDAEGKARQEEALRATDVAQPALGAVCFAAWRVLEQFGVRPALFAGHSYGELVALAAAGRIDEPSLWNLSMLRGRLMADAAPGAPGGMLAVMAPVERITSALAEAGLSLVLANKNAPEQTVLSGPAVDIDAAASAFAAKGIRAVRLPVAAAFHSAHVAAAEGPFRAALEGLSFARGTGRVFANTTAAEYPNDGRALLAGQLARPVDWVRQVEAMYAAGARTFIECGPGGRLCGLVDAILPGRAHECRTLDAGLAPLMGWLAARGHPVELSRWAPLPPETAAQARRRTAMTVPIDGANVVRQRPARPPRPPVSPSERNGTTKHAMSPPTPKPQPAPAPDNSALAQALALTRESLAALQRMQEQASALHRQFLDGQDATHRTVAQLVEQQQRLLLAAAGQPLPALPAPAPVALPPASRPTAWEGEPPAEPAIPVGQAPSLSESSTGKVPVPRGGPAEAPPPRAVAPPAPPPPAATSGDGHPASAVLLEVIAEKTGYPAEMLGLEMSLDADLGIDSIKRVEILSALQERLPDAPAVKPEQLGSFHTLADIAAFLAPAGRAAPAQPAPPAAPSGSAVLLEVIAEKTGYPAEMLGLEMSLDADLGIDSIKRVEILSALQERLPDAPAVKPEQLGSFHTLADIAAFLDGPAEVAPARPTEPAPVAPAQPGPALERLAVEVVPVGTRAARPLAGPVWVGGDDPALAEALAARLRALGHEVTRAPAAELANSAAPPSLAAVVLLAPPGEVPDSFVRDALFAVQTAGPGLRAARGALLTVSRLDGAFGLGGGAAWREPLDGALAGLAKTAGQEWKDVAARALDLSPALDAFAAAEVIERELHLEGPPEVGASAGATVTLRPTPRPALAGNFVPFRPGDLVVVSGGARGVTAEAAFALARQFRPTLLLLGRSPEPGPEPDWLAGLADEPAIKRELARRGPGRPPREVGEQARSLLAQREARQNLARLREAGARVLYRSADVRDAAAVAAILREARQAHGPVRGLVHGAGVLADARFEDKTPAQFDAVWGTKVDGLRALLAGCEEQELRAVVLFSSSTARFGRAGQVDYAMANEALNKLAWRLASPGRRVVSINWGPWEGGMVTPGLRKLFAREGIGLIPLEGGARLMCEELRQPPEGAREVVVLGPTQQPPAPSKLPAALPLAFERVASLDELPVVRDHVLDGKGVLPFALMLEWLAHAALAQNPGFIFHGADELRVLHGLFVEGAPFTVRVGAGKAARKDGLFVAPAELRSAREGREVLHARADILLANSLPPAPDALQEPVLPPYAHGPGDVYRKGLLFHGPSMHAFASIQGLGEAGAVATLKSAPPPGQWLKQPLRQHWITDPLVLDGCFQLAILWGRQNRGAAGLPCLVRRYRQYRKGMPATGARALLTVERATGLHAVAGLQLVDEAGQVLARAEGYEFVLDPGLERAYRRNQLVPA